MPNSDERVTYRTPGRLETLPGHPTTGTGVTFPVQMAGTYRYHTYFSKCLPLLIHYPHGNYHLANL